MPIDNLLLVPTEFEWDILSAGISPRTGPGGTAESPATAVRICGFGPITAAARAAALIAELRPSRVVLAGIAGSYGESLRVGAAYEFSSVASYGVGVGSGRHFRSASEMGWHQFHDSDRPNLQVTEKFELSPISTTTPAGTLLSCCSASATAEDATIKTDKHPGAVAEDMEAFGVAVSCALAGVPLSVIRGISNPAGDRDHARWKIDQALAAVAVILNTALER